MFDIINRMNSVRIVAEGLNQLNPVVKEWFFQTNDNTVSVLINEIWRRTFLLVRRVAKVFLSPAVDFISDRSLGSAWGCFCKEVRYLAADSFEYIGVIVCSVIHLPFKRKSSSSILKVQAWVEKQAEWISGESGNIALIKGNIDSANSKKELLLQISRKLELCKEYKDKFEWAKSGFECIVWENDLSLHRRICREFKLISDTYNEDLIQELAKMAVVFHDRIAGEVIAKQRREIETLISFGQFSESALLSQNCIESDPLSTKLGHFQDLQREKGMLIDRLHQRHDPQKVWFSRIEKLVQEERRDYVEAVTRVQVDAVLRRKSLMVGMGEIKNRFHFAFVKLREIHFVYDYGEVTEFFSEFSQEQFDDKIKVLMGECERLLREQRLQQECECPGELSRPLALRILGLEPEVSKDELPRVYRRLAVIHHPDKGGREDVFKRIKAAYDFLVAC